MKTFLNYLSEENVLATLIEEYNIKEKKIPTLVNQILSQASELELHEREDDFFGTIYEKCINPIERKALGEFYTPISIVNYILDAIGYKEDINIEKKKIADISCGSGSFLIQVIQRLIDRMKLVFNAESNEDLTPKEGKYIIDSVKNSVTGIDINPLAVILCQINIHHVLFEIYKLIKGQKANYSMPKFNILIKNALILDFTDKFDYIVGNPPYLFIRNIPKKQKLVIEKSNLETNQGQYDYYQIFIELGIKLIKNRGYLGYIVPDSLLALSNRGLIRKHVYNTTIIKEIYHAGPKFDDPVVSNVILILQKEYNIELRERNLVHSKLPNSQVVRSNKFVQKDIKKWEYKFLISLNARDSKILENLNSKFPKINDLMNNNEYLLSLSRGVELGKDGRVIYCDNCKKYYPLPKNRSICQECNQIIDGDEIEVIIRNKAPEKKNEHYQLFLHSINRYRINEYKYINVNKNGINYKNFEIYNDRIIIRQLSENNLICAAYDEKLSLTSQSFYNLKIIKAPALEFNNYYLLGLINSQLLSYHFMKSFGSYKILFPRILIEKIKQMPIKILDNKMEKQIALKINKNVKIMINSIDNMKNYAEEIQEKIDSMVYSLYQISREDQKYIHDFITDITKENHDI